MSGDYTEDQTLPVLADSGAPATITITTDAYHWCPFKDEPDVGKVSITWEAADQTIEIHSLGAWLDTLDEWTVSHEAYTAHIRDTLQTVGVRVTNVTTYWTTAGMAVEVTA